MSARMREAALAHFAAWAEEHHALPSRVADEAGAMLVLLEWSAEQRRWGDVLRLGRALEGPLALAGRLEAWDGVLRRMETAARQTEDRAALAFVLHQRGTRAGCLGEAEPCRAMLTQALALRRGLGDEAGAAVTRHNLDVFFAPPGGRRDEDGGPKPRPDGGGDAAGKSLNQFVYVVAVSVIALVLWRSPGFVEWASAPAGPASSASPAAIAPPPPPAISHDEPPASEAPSVPTAGPPALVAPAPPRPIGGSSPPRTASAVPDSRSLLDPAVRPPQLSRSVAPAFPPLKTSIAAVAPSASSAREEVRAIGGAGGEEAIDSGNGVLTMVEGEVQEVQIRNVGKFSIEIFAVELLGPGGADFEVIRDRCTGRQLWPGRTCPVWVAFRPKGPGERQALLHANANARALTSPVLRGVGTGP